MSVEDRPEFQAAIIQAKADGLTPEREAARESYRVRIASFISRRAMCAPIEKPMPSIGYEDGDTIS